MTDSKQPRPHRSNGPRDLLPILLAVVALGWLGARTGFFQLTHDWLRGRFPGREDDILLSLGTLTLGLTVFSMLRWREALREVAARNAAESRLREAEERYRTLVETIPAVTYIDLPDETSTTIYVSPQLETMLGYSADQWIGDTGLWTRELHPDDRDRVLSILQRHNTEGAPYDTEYRMRAADRSWKWIRDQAAIVRDDRGRPRLSQGVMFDVTQRRLAEEQLRATEEKYRALVEHIPAVLYVDTPEERAPSLYVSPQVERVLGVSQHEYLSDPHLWVRLIHPEDRERILAAYRESLSSAQGWAVEYRIVRPDGRLVWIRDESAFLLGEDGKPVLVQGVMFDVTERKLAEEALLSSERREREAAERLRALDEMKNTFLAAVSHELRSPLTSILGLALTLEHHDLAEPDRRDLLGRLAANSRKLDRLLSDLLDIDRLNRGIVTPQYRLTDLGALVGHTVETLDAAAERTIFVQADPVVVQVDPAKVERIVENLLVNAVRHTPPDRRVWVRVAETDGGALISVEDDGPGVPEELRDEIFEPFRQGPTASPHAPGTGIGLSLVAMFAELHGGHAWVQDRDGGGASFRVFLPGRPPSESGSEDETRGAVPAGPGRGGSG